MVELLFAEGSGSAIAYEALNSCDYDRLLLDAVSDSSLLLLAVSLLLLTLTTTLGLPFLSGEA